MTASDIATQQWPVVRLGLGQPGTEAAQRVLAVEQPVAIEINGVAYAVMMATPVDLEDFVTGFVLAEGLATDVAEIRDIDVATVTGGRIVRIGLSGPCAEQLHERIRLRLTEGSCGLCGIRSIEEALRPLPKIEAAPVADAMAVAAALAALSEHQPLGRATGAMHAAAFCDARGAVLLAREDVGRHNALDKLIGAMVRDGLDPKAGFILLSARCSYELVEKTVRAGCSMLVTISAPSDLAARRAVDSGLTLLALARSDSALVLSDPYGRFGAQAD